MAADNTILCPHLYDKMQEYLNRNKVNYLEIGLYNGAGFAYMARNNPEIHCIGVDPFIEDGNTSVHSNVQPGDKLTDQYQNTLNNIKGYENAFLNVMTSSDFFNQLTSDDIKKLDVGAILIDGDHRYDAVTVDLKLAMAVLDNKAGCIILDDLPMESVKQAFEEFYQEHNERIEHMENEFYYVKIYIKEKVE